MTREEAWKVLDASARLFNGDKHTGAALSQAAKDWALANGFVQAVGGAPASPSVPVKGTNGGTLRSGQVVPFGRDKGVPIEEADTKSLQWLAGAMRESIADPSKEKWAAKNRQLLDAIEVELETR